MTTIDPRVRDAGLPIGQRVEILLGQMTLPEKAGPFFQTMILPGPDGELSEGNPAFGLPSSEEYVHVRAMNHFNLLGAAPEAGLLATWQASRPTPRPHGSASSPDCCASDTASTASSAPTGAW